MIDELPGVPLQRPHGKVIEPEPEAAAADRLLTATGEAHGGGGE